MLPNVTSFPFVSPSAVVGREFLDRDGVGWRVWWSASAHTSRHEDGFAIRPPGIWFEQIVTGGRRYLFHPGIDASELARVPESWLLMWLARADPLPAAAPSSHFDGTASISAQVTTR